MGVTGILLCGARLQVNRQVVCLQSDTSWTDREKERRRRRVVVQQIRKSTLGVAAFSVDS